MAATKKQWIPGVDNMVVILGGVGVAAAAAYFIFKDKDIKILGSGANEETPPELPAAGNTSGSTPKATTPAPALDKGKILKKGSTGPEVKELQKLLGITADGIFGAQTEAALKSKKGVIQITLNEYNKVLTINQNPYKVGDTLMSNNKNGTPVRDAYVAADKHYYTNNDIETTIDFGKEIGKIIAVGSSGNSYVVMIDGFLKDYPGFVNHVDVKKI